MTRIVTICIIAALFSVLLADDALINQYGVPVKVITRRDCALYQKPDKSSASSPIKVFRMFYVLPSEPNTTEKLKNDFYRVSAYNDNSGFLGWVHKDDIVEWHHRQALGFAPREGRELAKFYASQDDLVNAYNNKKDNAAISQEPAQFSNDVHLLPILDLNEMELQGDKQNIFTVAYLHSKAGQPSSSGGTGEKIKLEEYREKFGLDIMFVVDTTKSMTPWIQKTREVVESILETIRSSKIVSPEKIRFGLVCYRDNLADGVTSIEYVTRTFCSLKEGSDHKKFLSILSQIETTKIDSEDWSEDVLAGLQDAIKAPDWNEMAWKQIYLIGDASAHISTNTYKNIYKLGIGSIHAMAQPDGNTREATFSRKGISTIYIKYYPEDVEKGIQQFTQISQIKYQPGNFYLFPQEDKQKFLETLLTDLQAKITGFQSSIEGFAKPDIAESVKKGEGFPKPVLEMLRYVDMEMGNPEIPVFASGFVAQLDKDGKTQVTPYLLTSRGTLQLFNSTLDFFTNLLEQRSGKGSTQNVNKIVTHIKLILSALNYNEPIDQNTPIHKLLSFVLGIPVKSTIFHLTPAELDAMTQKDYESWVKGVRESQKIIKAHLDNGSIWFSLDSAMTDEIHKMAYISIHDLP